MRDGYGIVGKFLIADNGIVVWLQESVIEENESD